MAKKIIPETEPKTFEENMQEVLNSAIASFKRYEADKQELSNQISVLLSNMTPVQAIEYYKELHAASNEAFSRIMTPLMAMSGMNQPNADNITSINPYGIEEGFEQFQIRENVGKKILQGITTLISVSERVVDDKAIQDEINKERKGLDDD